MPLKPKWKVPGARVITPVGYGEIGSKIKGSQIEIRLDQPWAGQDVAYFSPGEIVLDTDFTFLRILNVDIAGIITSAVNLPTWEEVCGLALYSFYCEDETLIGLNFETREVVSGRIWNHLGDFHQIECGLDRHLRIMPRVSETRGEAIEVWEREIGPIAGTSGALIIDVLLAFEDDKGKILARKILGTTMVLKDEHYY